MLEKEYILSPNEKKNLRLRQTNDLFAVLSFCCLDLGCMHRLREVYLNTGVLNMIPLLDNACGDACPICTGEWKKTFLPIRVDGLIKIFKCVDNLPCKVNYDNLLKLIWRQEYWFHVIFDKAISSVSKYNVEGLFMQLIANKLIVIRLINGDDHWVMCREE